MGPDHQKDGGRSRNTDEGKRMIRALEAAGLAWLMFNLALFLSLNRQQRANLNRETLGRFKRAML
jgi:hypothetical protein